MLKSSWMPALTVHHQVNGMEPLRAKLSSIEHSLKVDWQWEDGTKLPETIVYSRQQEIALKCDLLIKDFAQSEEFEIISEPAAIVFLSRFNLSLRSLVPWALLDSRRAANEILKKLDSEFIGNHLSNQIEVTLNQLRAFKRERKVDRSGMKDIHKMKILGKLVGNQGSDSFDKMKEFRASNVTDLGLVYTLVEFCDIEKYWKFTLPLLLAFFDDTDFMIKREACLCLDKLCQRLLLNKSATNIIVKSQTEPLLRESMLPLLLALPSLTPAEQCLPLIDVGYDALLQLVKIAFSNELRLSLQINSILNDILLPSMSKCQDYPEILTVLLNKLEKFFNASGKYKLVLSKQILYTVMTTLMDPYLVNATDVMKRLLHLLKLCLSESGEVERYKFDVLGCMGVLKRRVDSEVVVLDIENLCSLFE